MGKQFEINGVLKDQSVLSYDDLLYLVNQYIKLGGELSSKSFNPKNNLPYPALARKILSDNGMTLLEFLNMFDEYKNKFRYFDTNKYEEYVNQYIYFSKKRVTPLPITKLRDYNLPGADWFINNNPNDDVDSWVKFVSWCGFVPNGKNKVDIKNKSIIAKKLLQYEKELGRPLTINDIKVSTVGFSTYTILELWGSMDNCREQIGLQQCVQHPLKNWEYFDSQMSIALEDMYKRTGSKEFTWNMILDNKKVSLSREFFKIACERENINVDQYFKDKGFTLLYRNGSGVNNRFDDGELCVSSLEYRYSTFLRNNNIDYQRDVRYGVFDSNFKRKKTNCDYVLDDCYWVEICGMTKANNETWKTYKPHSKLEQDYLKKLIAKESSLKSHNIPFLFLFKDDFDNNKYIDKTLKLMQQK